MNSDCVFCKIIKGEMPGEKVYEDAETFAFLALHPTNKGQVLVIPKDHIENIYGFSDEAACRWMITIKNLAIAVKNSMDADGVNLIMNNEEAAGQAVFHAHMHIIPRFNDDGHKGWSSQPYAEGEIVEFGDKVRKEMNL